LHARGRSGLVGGLQPGRLRLTTGLGPARRNFRRPAGVTPRLSRSPPAAANDAFRRLRDGTDPRIVTTGRLRDATRARIVPSRGLRFARFRGHSPSPCLRETICHVFRRLGRLGTPRGGRRGFPAGSVRVLSLGHGLPSSSVRPRWAVATRARIRSAAGGLFGESVGKKSPGWRKLLSGALGPRSARRRTTGTRRGSSSSTRPRRRRSFRCRSSPRGQPPSSPVGRFAPPIHPILASHPPS
jgi:hypothetical protein